MNLFLLQGPSLSCRGENQKDLDNAIELALQALAQHNQNRVGANQPLPIASPPHTPAFRASPATLVPQPSPAAPSAPATSVIQCKPAVRANPAIPEATHTAATAAVPAMRVMRITTAIRAAPAIAELPANPATPATPLASVSPAAHYGNTLSLLLTNLSPISLFSILSLSQYLCTVALPYGLGLIMMVGGLIPLAWWVWRRKRH